jgi:hypothetical protein
MKITHEFAAHDAIEQMSALGFEVVGEHVSKHTLPELQGAPMFRGLLGPFWGLACADTRMRRPTNSSAPDPDTLRSLAH